METKRLPSQIELNNIWHGIHPDLPDFKFEWSSIRTNSAGTIFGDKRLIRLSVKHYLEFGSSIITDTLKHEAAHYLAWIKHNDRGHGKWFWYYSGMLGASRHCQPLSASMREVKVEIVGKRDSNGIEYNPVTKRFRQRR